MAYEKYKVKDDAQGNLDVGISSEDTTVILETGDGDNFPTYSEGEKSIGTLVDYDEDGAVTGKERVLITDRTDDSVTVTRGYDGDTQIAFSDNAILYINVTADVTTDIQDEVERLETDKLDKDGALRTGNGSWKVIYNNGDGDEVEVALGADGEVLKSNGPGAAPSFGSVSVADATDAIKGIQRIATDEEAAAGILETVTINPKQLKENSGVKMRTFSHTFDINYTVTSPFTVAHGCSSIPKGLIFSVQENPSGRFNNGSWSDDGTTETQRVYHDGALFDGVFSYHYGSDYYCVIVDSVDATNITFSADRSGTWSEFDQDVVITCFF